LLLSLFHAFP
jgi:hypothetical protein